MQSPAVVFIEFNVLVLVTPMFIIFNMLELYLFTWRSVFVSVTPGAVTLPIRE